MDDTEVVPTRISRARAMGGFHLDMPTVRDPRPVLPAPDYSARISISMRSFRGIEFGYPRIHAAKVLLRLRETDAQSLISKMQPIASGLPVVALLVSKTGKCGRA